MKHKTGQRIVSGAMAALLCCSSLPLSVFAEEATSETAAPVESQQEDWLTVNGMDEILFGVLPDEPTGAYMSSRGLPVATGETKLSISPWRSELATEGDVLDAEALNAGGLTMTVSRVDDETTIVPLLVQVEYPANGSTTTIELPEGVELLSYDGSQILDGEARDRILTITHEESAASAQGIFVAASEDFAVTVQHHNGDTTLEKTLQVQITDTSDASLQQPEAGIAVQADRPTPSATTGKITRCEYVVNTWLIWFNGEEAYCCDNGLNGQPAGCPTYSYTATSTLDPGQYTGDHYTTQISIWGGIGQLSLDGGVETYALPQVNEALSEEEALLDFCGQIYNETQMHIIRNYPDSEAAQIYRNSALQLMQGVMPLASATGYYTYLYSPPIGGWQRVALIGPPIQVERYDASWSADVTESATASFDVTLVTRVNKSADVTHELLGDAQITVRPAETGGTLDGGNWSITPAEQIIRTENGDGSVSWHYTGSVSRSASRSDNGSVAGYSSQAEADAAAEAERAAAEQRLREEARTVAQAEANTAAQQAAAAARQFVLAETGVPHGFTATDSSNQTITVQPNGEATATITNTPWRAKVEWNKRDSLTGSLISGLTQFAVQEWDAAAEQYVNSPNYTVTRLENGVYTVRVANGAYTDWEQGYLYYTQSNQGKYRIIETGAPDGYQNDGWTLDIVIDQPDKVISALEDNAAKDGPWRNPIEWEKVDSATGERLQADTQFAVLEWNTATQAYGASQYTVVRREDGLYTVAAPGREQGHLFYTEGNAGRFLIQEIAAPNGYNNDGWRWEVQLTEDGALLSATGASAAKDSPWKADVLWRKYDALTGQVLSAETAFTVFEWSRTEQKYLPCAYTVSRLANGNYTVAGGLYYTEANEGKFQVIETKAPQGYNTDPWTLDVVIDEPNQVIDATGFDFSAKDGPWKAKVLWNKYDALIGKPVVAETGFTVYEWSRNKRDYLPSEHYSVVRLADGRYTVQVDGSYTGAAQGYLYYTESNEGRFEIRETQAPHGYNLDPWTLAVVIDQPDKVVDATGLGDSAKDAPWEAELRWEKLDAITGGRLTEDTEFQLLEWSAVENAYRISPNYKVIRKADGIYTVRAVNADFAPIWKEGCVYYSEDNLGKFKIEEITPAYGYTSDTQNGKASWAVEFESTQQGQVVEYLGENADRNRPQGTKIIIDKVDSETGNRIAADAVFTLYEWNAERGLYEVSPNYAIVRGEDGRYTASCLHESWKLAQEGYLYFEDTLCDRRADTVNHDGTTSTHAIYYTDYDMVNYPNDRAYTNDGQFLLVETKAPNGYLGDWSDTPGNAGSDLGKRAYYLRLAGDGGTIKLGNADYNADVLTENKGGILVETPDGTVTVEINATAKPADRTYTTDPTGLAANEDSYTEIAGEDTFKNTHVLGYLELSKVDLDAAKRLADNSNGNTTLEGAVYDLYAAEDIQHPDGVTGVVDYAKIADANGNPIWHTTVFDGNHWNESYLPILQKDHLVASAAIKDGKLAFANLYMGQYYLVERATGVKLPVDANGKLYTSGHYPLLDKRLQATGKYQALATDGSGRYTDYLYKNQYSTVAEGRALDGTKTYDGYYLSYAKGYLCDEINHYATLSYNGESAYLIRSEAQSEDAVLKSGLSLQKLVSTTGQPSPAIKLAGAGFTVYRIDRLSKAAEFAKNPDGSYNAQSILDAYRRDNYDNATLKYDFSKEEQAVATMYENNPDLVAAYNFKLTANGDNAYGSGNGWQATGKPNEYRLAEIFTNEEGRFTIEGLPYGEYLVVETTIPKDLFQADPFVAVVNQNSPQSAFAIPAGGVTKPSNSYMTYNILDEELEGYLELRKIDAETGKLVRLPNTAFQLYRIAEDGKESLIEMTDPHNGSATAKTSVFYTDAEGRMKTPEKLPLGKYRVIEIEGPNGFYLDEQYDVVFELTSETAWEVIGNEFDDMDTYIITKEYQNHEVVGQFTIRKTGEVLTGWNPSDPSDFVYTTRPLPGAEYTVYAAEDIYTQDRQLDADGNRSLWYAARDVVAVVTTGDGTADTVTYAPTRTGATHDFLSISHDTTVGEVTVTVPLGKYRVTETNPPYGFTATNAFYEVEFVWDSQDKAVVSASRTVYTDEQGNTTTPQDPTLRFHNEREKAEVSALKLDAETGKPLAGAVFGLYTADAIYDADGNLLHEPDTLLATSTASGEDGVARFAIDLPLRNADYDNSGNYYVVELQAPTGYLLNPTRMDFTFTYDGQAVQLHQPACDDTPSEVWLSKRDLTHSDELPGATLAILDTNGDTVQQWVSGDEPTRITALPLGEVFTLTELHPAPGYTTAQSIQFRLSQRRDENSNLLQETQVEILQQTEPPMQQGTILSPTAFSDEAPGNILAEIIRGLGDLVRETVFGNTPQREDARVIARWTCYANALTVTFTDDATDTAIRKTLRESDFTDLSFDAVYLVNGKAPHFFADLQREEPAPLPPPVEAHWTVLEPEMPVIMRDAPTRIRLSKVDITNQQEIPGAGLRLLDSEGNVIEAWTSTDTPHYIEAVLEVGKTYILEETLVPLADGYVQANRIEFTVEDTGAAQHLLMQDDHTKVLISKTDIVTGEEIPGASLQIVDGENNVVAAWVTDGQPHLIERLPQGRYTLIETQAPTADGYVRAASIQFVVDDTSAIQKVVMQDDFTKVEISKRDITDGKELPGATLMILDRDGREVATWVSDGTPHRIDKLAPGDYLLIEQAAPAGYQRAEEVRFTVKETGEIQKVVMYDAPEHGLWISKQDAATHAALAGAQLVLKDSAGNVLDRWNSTDTAHEVTVLRADVAEQDPRVAIVKASTVSREYWYELAEESAPQGYRVAEPITFKVELVDSQTLRLFCRQNGTWVEVQGNVLTMLDARDIPTDSSKPYPQTGAPDLFYRFHKEIFMLSLYGGTCCIWHRRLFTHQSAHNTQLRACIAHKSAPIRFTAHKKDVII